MICDRCGTEVSEDKLLCPNCNRGVASAEQQRKLDEVKLKQTKEMETVFNAPVFLAFSIIMTVLCITQVCNVIGYLILALKSFSLIGLISLLLFVVLVFPAVRTTIACWGLYFKKGELNVKQLGGMANFPRFQKGFFKLISGIFYTIVTLILIGVLFLGAAISDIASQLGASELLKEATTSKTSILAILIAAAVIIGISVALTSIIHTYGRIANYYEFFASTYANGWVQFTERVSNVRLYVLAAVCILFSGTSLIGFSLLSFFGFGMLAFSNGLYLIATAIFFSYIDKKRSDSLLEYQVEHRKLEEINLRTTRELNEINRAKREKEYEAARIEAQKQVQQQQMMKNMMDSFLANGMQMQMMQQMQQMQQLQQMQQTQQPQPQQSPIKEEEIATTKVEKENDEE